MIVSDDATGYGPIFEEEPVDVVYTEDSPDKRISINCRARANPPASYRWGIPHPPLFEILSLYMVRSITSSVFITGGAGITGKSSWRSNLMSTTVWLGGTWWSLIPSTTSTPACTRAWPRTSTAPCSAKRPGSSLDVSADRKADPWERFELKWGWLVYFPS